MRHTQKLRPSRALSQGVSAPISAPLALLIAAWGTAHAVPLSGFSLLDQTSQVRSGQDVILGDLNGDGYLDAFVVNTNAQPNRVYLNTTPSGTDGFTAGPDLGAESSQGVALGDLDNDGDLDAFVANDAANNAWLNDGLGGFVKGANIGNENSRAVALGDLDGDGDLDAFVANEASDRVYLNQGGGNFANNGQLNLDAAQGTGVGLYDFDGQNRLDAIVCNNNADATILTNNGGALFTLAYTFPNTAGATALHLADFNQDGKMDVYFAMGNNTADLVAINTTVGTTVSFDPVQAANGVPAVSSAGVDFYDANNDQRPDLLAVAVSDVNINGNRLFDITYDVNGLPVFAPRAQVIGNERTEGVAVADLDQDSDPDLFFVSFNSTHKVWHFKAAPTGTADAAAEGLVVDEDQVGGLTLNAPGVLGNDVDVEAFTLGDVQLVTDVTDGTLTLNADGSLTYAPNADFFGTDTFTYTMTDGTQTSQPVTASITVNSVNDAPVATDSVGVTPEDTLVTLTPDVSDVDDATAALTITITSAPTSGLVGAQAGDAGVAVVVNGQIEYTPALHFNGTATIGYEVADPAGLTATATVTVTVNAVDDAPEADSFAVTTNEDSNLDVDLLDTASPTPAPKVREFDGESLTVSVAQQPAHGVVTVNGLILTYSPALNYFGPDSFVYEVTDGITPVQGTISVTVVPQDDGPATIGGNKSYTTFEDTPLVVNPGINSLMSDVSAGVDTNETLTVEVTLFPTTGTLVITDAQLGSFTYTPAANANGATFFRYRVYDGTSYSNTVAATINVTPVNDAPNAVADSITTDEDTAGSVNVVANDTDVESNPISLVSCDDGANGTTSVAANVVTYTPAQDFNGADSFNCTVTDGTNTSTSTVNVTVNPLNDDPVANADADSTNEETSVTVNVTANDTDVDGDNRVISSCTDGANGTTSVNANVVTYTPAQDFNGTDVFTCTISDGNGGSDSADVTITVNPINDPPVANDDTATTDEDMAVTVTVTTNDTDVDGDALVITSCTPGANGTTGAGAPGEVVYTPNLDFNGDDSFDCTISDGNGGSNTATVTVTVTPINDAPDAVADSLTTDEDVEGVVDVLDNDSDVDEDTLSVTGCTDGANGITVVNADNTVSYLSDTNYFGPDSFDCTISDGALSDTATVTVTVNPVNDYPSAVDDAFTISEDDVLQTWSVTLNDTDVESDPIALDFVYVSPSRGALNVAGNDLEYTPGAHENGDDIIVYGVSDRPMVELLNVSGSVALGSDARHTISLAQPMSLNFNTFGACGASDEEDTVITVYEADGVTVVDSDDDSNDTLCSQLSLSLEAGDYVVAVSGANGAALSSYSLRVSEGDARNIGVVRVTITPVNDDPVAADDALTTDEDTEGTVDVLANDTDIDVARGENDSLSVADCEPVSNQGGIVDINPDGTVSYLPADDFNGIDSFDCLIVDQGGGFDISTVSVTVTPVNDAPVALADSLTLAEDTSNTVNVLTNDSDIDGNSITVAGCDQGTNGATSFNSVTGLVTYTPEGDFFGADSFDCTITDGALTATATVTVTVTPVPDAPVAIDDELIVTEDVLFVADGVTPDANNNVFEGVLNNDYDVDGDVLTVRLVTPPVAGALTLNDDGSFTYLPELNSTEAVGFFYEILENGVPSGVSAFVFLTIAPVNDLPVANADGPVTVAEDSVDFPIAGLLANDTDVANENQTLTISRIDLSPINGSARVSPDGLSILYTPNANYPNRFQAFNGAGSDSLSYFVTDGVGESLVSATVTIAVTPVSDAPVANDDSAVTDEETLVLVTVLGNDADADADELFITEVNGQPIAADGTVDVGDALVTLRAESFAKYFEVTPKLNFVGQVSFTYTINDGSAEPDDVATVVVTVNPVNDSPVAQPQAFNDGVEDTVYSAPAGALLVGASDVDVGDAHTTELVVGSAVGGVVVVGADGSFSVTPDQDVNGLSAVTFSYVVRDSSGAPNSASAPATVSLDLAPVNDAPVAVDDGVVTLAEEGTVSVAVLGNDSDVDGDVLSITSVSALSPTDAGLAVVAQVGGVDTLSVTGGQDYFGPATLTYTISDGNGGSATATVQLNITNVNDAPVAVADTLTVNEDLTTQVLGADLVANDTDADNDALTAQLVGAAVNAVVVDNGDGSFSFTPTANFNGVATFSYQAVDPSGALSAPVVVTVTVTDINDAPVANADTFAGATEEQPFSAAAPGVLANDTDLDVGDVLSAELVVGSAVGGSVALAPNGSFTFTPTANFFGVASFRYVTRDDGGLVSGEATVSITFANTPDAPVAVADAGYTVAEDAVLTVAAVNGLLLNDTDADNDALTAAVATQPANGVVTVSANGGFTYTPAANYNGPDSFTYTVTDGGLTSAPATVSLTVTPVNDGPTAVAQSYTTAEDSALTVAAAQGLLNGAADIDDDLSTLTAALVAGVTVAQGVVVVNADGSFTYTPAQNFNGAASFTYQAVDPSGARSQVRTVSLTVTAVNDAPVAVADAYSVVEDIAFTANVPGVRANDTDVDGDALTVALVGDVSNGVLALNANGAFSYTPAQNYTGPDSFTYTVTDGALTSAPATVTLTVTPVNDAPVAAGEVYSTDEDTPLTVAAPGLLANDSDIDSANLTAALVQGPTVAQGTLVLNADGSFVLTPAANYSGAITFTYQAFDGALRSASATVTVTVAPVNDAPVARADNFVTPEDVTLTRAALGGLLANDSDVDSAFTVVGNTPASNGDVQVSADGAFTYDPIANFNGVDSFTYTIRDAEGLEATASVTITVGGENDAPVAVADAVTTDEDVPVQGDVLANDSDVDVEPLTANLIQPPPPAEGVVTLESNGMFTFTPAPNFNGESRFSYQAADVLGVTSDVTVVTVTVLPVNDAPVPTDDDYETLEDTALTVDVAAGVLANDVDIDSVGLVAVVVAAPTRGVVELAEDGSFVYTPEADFNGDDSFTYTVTDGEFTSAEVTVSLVVTAVEDAPVASADAFEVAEEGTLTVDAPGVLANDTDSDVGAALSAQLVTDVDPALGDLTLNPDGSFVFTPVMDVTGEVTFTYAAFDGGLSSEPVTVTVTVTPVNDAPVAVADAFSGVEDEPLVVAAAGVLANDLDVDGDALVAILVDGVPVEAGSLTLELDGSLVFAPAQDFSGEVTFTYVARDPSDEPSEPVTVTLSLLPVNDAPVASSLSFTVAEDSTLSAPAGALLEGAVDIDSDLASLAVAVDAAPAQGELVVNADGSFTYAPVANFNGEVTFTYTVTDGEGVSAAATVTITVTPVNDAPALIAPTPVDALVAAEGEALVFVVAGEDLDGDALTYSVTGAPESASFDAQTGAFSWTPTYAEAGTYTLTLSVTDGSLSDSREVTLTVSLIDLDADGLPDSWEVENGLNPELVDSDGDTIDDVTEVGGDLSAPSNVDGDDLIDALDLDSDGDGVSDAEEAGDDDLATAPVDSDEDGVADFRDVDSDEDGAEDGVDVCRLVADADQADLDADGLGDACDEDIDGDGLLNEVEEAVGMNARSVDSDGDSISDAVEFGEGEAALDTDGDGDVDAVDEDSDDDGLSDADEAGDAELATAPVDSDGDGAADYVDADSDDDGADDGADNCRLVANPGQEDTNGDGLGDACDGDLDGDGVLNEADNCPMMVNQGQEDADDDDIGDVCDSDRDGDGVDNDADTCPDLESDDQADTDSDGLGDACDSDLDGDGAANEADNCPSVANEGQEDADEDGEGDVCDETPDPVEPEPMNQDRDGDGVDDSVDNCPVLNADQLDTDGDGEGDACDTDLDNDTVLNDADNCRDVANEDQADADGDGEGDLCDETPDPVSRPRPSNDGCAQPATGASPLLALALFALCGLVVRRRRVA